MKRGLVIGKFMPVHEGHVALIRFAARHCDELIVSMSYSPHDPIPGHLRFEWLREIFKNESSISLYYLVDDFDDESLAWPERTRVWSEQLRKRYGKVDRLISSEVYGSYLAEHLQAENVLFDPERKQISISASEIRQRPFQFWNFIPVVVRPYFVKKICFYGPESTGKSTMAKRMAEIYQTEWVPEVARELITSNEFSAEDIVRIGQAQTQRVLDKTKTANKILFCDTDLITTQIYSQKYLQFVPPVLNDLERKVHYDLYFLFNVDVAWVPDGLRDLGNQREGMYQIFKTELERRSIPYVEVSGSYEQREKFIKREVDHLLSV
jgi:HTH-type transcriptional repressor of NAD biosynthesis genes